MKAIPQRLNGILYRSRTEARWAWFWHETGTPFEYEPEGYDLGNGDFYAPDFLLTHRRIYFEVKPASPSTRELRVARKLAHASGRLVVIAAGAPSAGVLLLAISPTGREMPAYLVNEHEGSAVWLVEDMDGGGWCIPLADRLRSPHTGSGQHLSLNGAGRLQFDAKREPGTPSGGPRVVLTAGKFAPPRVVKRKIDP